MSAREGSPGAVRAAVASAPAAAALCGSPAEAPDPASARSAAEPASVAPSSVEPVETPGPSALVADVVVRAVERLSPSFVRVTLAGPALVDLGEDGFDTRFKLVLPGPSEVLPAIPDRVEDYWGAVQELPSGVRPAVRTYTVRDVLRRAGEALLVVDLVVHDEALVDAGASAHDRAPSHGGSSAHVAGPACRWALAARPGDRLQVVVPHRDGTYGGTEFDPGGRGRLLLVGDATAVPAIARILTDLPYGRRGHVFVEAPTAADLALLPERTGMRVHRSVTDGRPGRRLVADVRRHLGLPDVTPPPGSATPAPGAAGDDVWETPRFSASGEDVIAPGSASRRVPPPTVQGLEDLHAWIAGESWMVRTLRRALVGELGLDRAQVAFMGYWREGVAMR